MHKKVLWKARGKVVPVRNSAVVYLTEQLRDIGAEPGDELWVSVSKDKKRVIIERAEEK